jgi:hypothetical protein
MRHAGHHEPPQEYDLGIEATQIFPALGREHERPAGRAWDQGRPDPPRRMRLNHWVMAAGCLTGAIAAYVAFATAGAPARPMPSPFAPVTHHAVVSRGTVNCATPLPGPRSDGCARRP